MKVLVLGSGGREHAIVWKLRQSPRIKKLYCAPGSGGISADAESVAVDLKSLDSMVQLASKLNPDITVVGPELPLTLGVVDEFQRRGWRIFGPTKAAAQLESSKSFSKEFMQRHRIPTAHYAICTKKSELKDALAHFHTPIVVKADGLAAGKGVVIAQTKDEAQRVAEEMLSGKMLGEAGSRVVLEEFLKGEELSFLVMSDGERWFRWWRRKTTSGCSMTTRDRTPAAWAHTRPIRSSTPACAIAGDAHRASGDRGDEGRRR